RRAGEDFEPPRRIRRAQFLGLLVPVARRNQVGGNTEHLELTQHERIVGGAQHQGGFGVVRLGGPLQQQAGRRDVARRDEGFGASDEPLDLLTIELARRRSSWLRGSWLRGRRGCSSLP